MALYICKCGRQVNKSTSADNTGNRDTADCIGCPYLLPWGPNKYVEGRGFRKEIQGYECRMSPTISYTTTYRGQANDKCTLHILSLDLDFLDTVQAWIYDHAADTLTAGFSRGSMRGTDFSDKGRYSLSISCAQNKKGMAAKAALIEQFFTGGRVRKDMTLAQEKAHILSAIQRGKEQAQGKDQPMKRQNDRCPLQQECERTCKVIGHERDCDYYVNNRYCTEGIPDQDELLTEEELRQEREREERYLASLSAEPAEPVVYQNEYGTLFAVREHKGAPALMCKAKEADSWALSGVLAAVQGEAYTAADQQEVLDEYARAHGWKKAAPEQKKEDYSPCEGCRCPDCDDEACPQAHCDKSDKGLGCIAPDGLCPPVNTTDAAADAPPCAPTVSDAQPLPSPNADAGAKTGANGEVAACACYGCKRSDCTCAGGRDVFGRSDCDGHYNCSQSECTHDIRHRANPTPAAPASRADAGAATQSLSAAGSASLAAEAAEPPAFDYSGLDVPTRDALHWAEKEIGEARRDYIARLAQAVAIAHDALCSTGVRNSDSGKYESQEDTFISWCKAVGLSKTTAYQLLQVQALLSGSTPEEQATLEAASPSLLYAAAKPSAPEELVQAVKDGDITTHKQYQDLLARYNAERAAREKAEKDNDFLRADSAKARDAAHTYHRQYDEVAAQRNALIDQQGENIRLRMAAEKERDEALKQRDGARDALQAAKLRGDKLKAENEALKAQPVEAQVVDEEEVNRRAQARADELTAPLREELEALRARHPTDLEEAEQAIRDAYDSAIYTGRVMENAWHTLRPLLPRMDADRRELALNQIINIISSIQGECIACL